MNMEGNGRSSTIELPGLDRSWRGLYQAGGVSALLVGVLYLAATMFLFIIPMQGGYATSGGAATLQYIASNRSVYIIEQLLYNAPIVLAMITFLALYPALKHLDKSYAAIGALLGIGSEIVSLTIFNSIAGLVSLSDEYAASSTDAQRAIFSTAAESIIAQTNIAFAAGVVTAIGILVISIVMLKGIFSKRVAYLGIITGILGIISEGMRTMLGASYIIYGILLMVWFLVIGWELVKIGRERATSI